MFTAWIQVAWYILLKTQYSAFIYRQIKSSCPFEKIIYAITGTVKNRNGLRDKLLLLCSCNQASMYSFSIPVLYSVLNTRYAMNIVRITKTSDNTIVVGSVYLILYLTFNYQQPESKFMKNDKLYFVWIWKAKSTIGKYWSRALIWMVAL